MSDNEVYRFDNTNIFIVSNVVCKPKEKTLLTKMAHSIGFSISESTKEEQESAKMIISLGFEYHQSDVRDIKLLKHPSFILKDYSSRILSYWDNWLFIKKYIEEHNLV